MDYAAIITGVAGLLGIILTALLTRSKQRSEANKLASEAIKLEAEARATDWARFSAEIKRQDEKIARLEQKLTDQAEAIRKLEKERDSAEEAIEARDRKISSLRGDITKLKMRLTVLEKVICDHGVPEEKIAEAERVLKLGKDGL